jgi:tRNA dimethylallyltransferase
VALAGPTACGKTAAALAVATRLPVEIVSVDSALVYQGMDIGTAKPTAAERAAVPHHLIDIRDPREAYSAAEFAADAARLVREIRGRGALPLLVGGTMLYFKALFEGLAAMPAADPAVRAALDADAAALGWPAMHARLAQVDPLTAARLAPNDSQRIQRALEVWQISGRTLSDWHAGQTAPATAATVDTSGPGANGSTHGATGLPPSPETPLPPALFISMEPEDRAWLHGRIAQRFEQMLADGFLDEVRALRARGDLSPDLPSMRCVGYRQAWEWLDAHSGEMHQDAASLCERGIAATRQLAKRQITWLRSMPARQVIAGDQPQAVARVVEAIESVWTRLDPSAAGLGGSTP